MRALISLFGRSPFSPLQRHMDEVAECIWKISEIFDFYQRGEQDDVERLMLEISELEHSADRIKNDIRNRLPKGLFLPVDKNNLLEILSLQDCIADIAENIGVILTLRPYQSINKIEGTFNAFLEKNIEAFQKVKLIIDELNELLESSFGGVEAEKVKKMVDEVAYHEHEADLLQRSLLKILYNSDGQADHTIFFLWMHIIEEVGGIANLSEKLANRVRMTLDLK